MKTSYPIVTIPERPYYAKNRTSYEECIKTCEVKLFEAMNKTLLNREDLIKHVPGMTTRDIVEREYGLRLKEEYMKAPE